MTSLVETQTRSGLTRFFADLDRRDVAFAGGKGANLGELTRGGFAVPAGFVLGAPAYERFVTEGGLRDRIAARLETVDVDDSEALRRAADEVRAMVAAEPVPPAVEEAVRSAYGELGADSVSVRSSATAEDTEAARGLVNAWTAEQTHDRIPQIIPPGVLDALTRLVLVNALYLKAPWETPFEKGSTRPGDFHRLDGSVVRTDLMQGAVGGSLLVADGWQALRIPYAGGALAMTVVLPDRGRLPAVDTLLREQGVAGFLADGAAGEVQLTLPSWTFRSDTPLGDVLVALGMTDAFDAEAADFDPMTEDPNGLFVSAVLHQTFIAVDEDGTEAAAATAVVMQDSAVLVSDRLVVDRPFLFVVHDTAHGTPYFLGRVLDPSAT